MKQVVIIILHLCSCNWQDILSTNSAYTSGPQLVHSRRPSNAHAHAHVYNPMVDMLIHMYIYMHDDVYIYTCMYIDVHTRIHMYVYLQLVQFSGVA